MSGWPHRPSGQSGRSADRLWPWSYGLLDHDHVEVIEFYPSKEAADWELAEILHDEPDWAGRFEVVLVDFSGDEADVTRSL